MTDFKEIKVANRRFKVNDEILVKMYHHPKIHDYFIEKLCYCVEDDAINQFDYDLIAIDQKEARLDFKTSVYLEDICDWYLNSLNNNEEKAFLEIIKELNLEEIKS